MLNKRDKHNNKLGKVGSVQIEIPSYQPSGNFTMEFTPDGVSSFNIDGTALAVDGDTCNDGGSVYAYIREFDDTTSTTEVSEIAATPSVLSMAVADTKTLSVIGLRGGLYAPIELENSDCTFSTDSASIATVTTAGVVTAVATGTTYIRVTYGTHKDVVEVTVA